MEDLAVFTALNHSVSFGKKNFMKNFRRVLQIDFRYDGSTSTVTSRIESIRHHLQPPFVVTRGIFSKCLADRLPV